MANQINVFELTNTTLSSLTESKKPVAKKVASRKLSESAKITKKKPAKKKLRKESVAKISCKKLRLESVRFAEDMEADEFDFTPEDEVVVVVDPEMDEVPVTEEEAQAAAEELVGDTVCKCSVCGANYVCDCDNTIQEDVDGEIETCVEDGTCPVCGEDAPQIVVGEIVSTDEVEEPVEDTDDSDSEPVETVDDDEITVDDDEITVDDDEITVDDDDLVIDDEGDTDTANECVRKPARKRPVRRESTTSRTVARRTATRKPALRRERVATPSRKPIARTARPMARKSLRTENRMSATRRMPSTAKRPVASKVVSSKSVNFNESALNRLFTKFAKENYRNIVSVRFTKGNVIGSKLTVEGVVRTTSGCKRNIKLVAEGFKPMTGRTLKLKCREYGPFTESARISKDRVPFVVECTVRGGAVTPVSMKYAYVTKNSGLKESKGKADRFSVTGIVK